VKNYATAYDLSVESLSTEQIHLLPDILANADILLAFEPLSEYIHYRLFSDNEPLPGDSSHLL
jgi:hypothetical protein